MISQYVEAQAQRANYGFGRQIHGISHIFVANRPIYMIFGAYCSVGLYASFVPFAYVS